MKPVLVAIIAFILLSAAGPLAMRLSDEVRLGQHWSDQDRGATGLAPAAATTPEAVVQVYAARAFSWRGQFAVHAWIATKPAGAASYTRHEVTAWRRPVLSSRRGNPDGRWAGAEPRLLFDLRGPAAAQAIPQIQAVVDQYPFAMRYRAWPGPNSNTFVAWVIRRVPALTVELPPTALGKDYLGDEIVADAPSGSGYQISFHGLAGLLLARDEGVEINLLGLVWGIDPGELAIKWPGLGRIGFRTAASLQPVPPDGG